MTTEQVRKLSDEELRVEVARRLPAPEDDAWRIVPNYPGDLNACHEMETDLLRLPSGEMWSKYVELLKGMWAGLEAGAIRATARQRCEAFVMVKGNQDD